MMGYILQSVVDSYRDPSVVTMNIDSKRTGDFTVFVVDSRGVPVPNARIGFLSNSGWMYSETNEFGYSDHPSGENDIRSITINGKVILEDYPLSLYFPRYVGIFRKVFLIRIDN